MSKNDTGMFLVRGTGKNYSQKNGVYYVAIDSHSGGYPWAADVESAETFISISKAIKTGIPLAKELKFEKIEVVQIVLETVDISKHVDIDNKMTKLVEGLTDEELEILKGKLK